jgi:ATP-dependent Clp protease ATP-binding subunit ClpC
MTDKNIALTLNQDAREYLVEKGWDPNFGARPLKRALQKYLEDPMSEEILKGEYTGNFHVEVSRHPDEDRLKFEIKKLSTEEMEPEKSNAAE